MMEFYVVGGFCRDLVLGNQPKDVDYVITGSSIEEMEMFGFEQVGADFPVFLHPIHKSELALARIERKVSSGYLGFECDTKNVTIEEDLSRRDFSMNAMAIHVRKMNNQGIPTQGFDLNPISVLNIIDPFNGIQDIKDRIIRHIGPAFSEDPVRALRACRFTARYDFKIAEETKLLIKDMDNNGELNYLVPERIWNEILKVFASNNPHIFFEQMEQLGIHHVIHNFKFEKELSNISKYSIEEQTILLALSNVDNPNFFEDLEKLKVPNDCLIAAKKFMKVKNLLVNPSAERFMRIIDILELTKTTKWFKITRMIIEDFFPDLIGNRKFIFNIISEVNNINFGSLNVKEQSSLKGPEIGETIRKLRVKLIQEKMDALC